MAVVFHCFADSTKRHYKIYINIQTNVAELYLIYSYCHCWYGKESWKCFTVKFIENYEFFIENNLNHRTENCTYRS